VNDRDCDASDSKGTSSQVFGEDGRVQQLITNTEVFSVGVHPRRPDLIYIHGSGLRGYVNQYSFNFDLPVGDAKLHSVQSGETVRDLAIKMFGSSVKEGIDLRFYENVLLYVNCRHPAHNTQGPGIDGLYNNTANLSPIEIAR